MKYATFLKIALICLTILLFSCEKDEIKVSESEYVSGGIGTSQTSGAIEFNFIIPHRYSSGKVSVELSEAHILNEVRGTGNKQIRFLNIPPGIYNYTLEFWALENSYSNGGIDEGTPLNKYYSLHETLEVYNGKTLKIKVDLD